MPDRIEIYIAQKQAEARRRRPKKTPKDIGSRRRQNEPLPRRLRKGASYINFWDLGSRKDGTGWKDLVYKTVTWNYDAGYAQPNAPNLAQWQGMISEIFSVSVADWKSEYRKLSYADAERFGVDIHDQTAAFGFPPAKVHPAARANSRFESLYGVNNVVTGAKWTEGGLDLKPEDFTYGPGRFSVQSAGLALTFGAGNLGQKVTATNDYNASPVSFQLALGKPINVFLVPRLAGHTVATSSGPPNFDLISEIVGPFKPMSRTMFLDLVLDDVLPGSPANYPAFASLANYTVGLSTAKLTAFYNSVKNDPLSKSFQDPGGTGIVETAVSGTPTYGVIDTSQQLYLGVGKAATDTEHPLPAGLLTGVIEQEGQFYYFWNTGENPDIDNTGVYPLNLKDFHRLFNL